MILFRYVCSNSDVELIPVLQTPICHTYVVSFNIDRSIDYIEVELFEFNRYIGSEIFSPKQHFISYFDGSENPVFS